MAALMAQVCSAISRLIAGYFCVSHFFDNQDDDLPDLIWYRPDRRGILCCETCFLGYCLNCPGWVLDTSHASNVSSVFTKPKQEVFSFDLGIVWLS